MKFYEVPASMKACATFGLAATAGFAFLGHNYLARFCWKPQAGWPPAVAGGGY